METFKGYRFRLGLVGNNTDPELLKNAWREYRRQYLRAYRQKRVSSKVRRELTFTKAQDKKITTLAQQHNQTPARFIRSCVLSFAGKEMPPTKEITDLIFQLRKIGNNINQIAYITNRDGGSAFDSTQVHQQLLQLEQLIVHTLGTIPDSSNANTRERITQTLKG